MSTKPCRTCGKPFQPLANQAYCGDPCRSPSLTHYGSLKEPVPCANCGKEFTRRAPTQTYCSPRCREQRGRPPALCRGCGKPFKRAAGQLYCSEGCKPTKTPNLRSCPRCEKSFAPTGGQRYCSVECREAGNVPRWTLNPNIEYKQSTWRKHVLTITGGECLDCGATEGLEVHHIIPRARGGKNVIGNGMVLCRPCHELRHDPSMATDDLVERIATRVVEIIDNR